MKSKNKSRRYKVTRTAISMPLAPMLADDEKLGRGALKKGLRVKGFKSSVANIVGAEALAKQKINYCKKLRGSEQVFAVQQLIDENPQFALEPWIGAQYYKFKKSGRSMYARGRPKGGLSIDPLHIFAMVRHLIASGTVASPEAAFHQLEMDEVTTYDVARNRYRQAMSDSRFRAVLLEDPASAKYVEIKTSE